MKISVLLCLLAALSAASAQTVAVCGHAFPFPAIGTLTDASIRAMVQLKRTSVDYTMTEPVTTDKMGAFCITNLPGGAFATFILEKSGRETLQSPQIELPASGVLLPELTFQVPSHTMIRTIMTLEETLGTGAKWRDHDNTCLAVVTVIRPCQGMYSFASHGLKGAQIKLYQVTSEGEVEVPSEVATKVYEGVTKTSLPSVTGDRTAIVKAGPTSWFNEQDPSRDAPSSWDGGIFLANVPKGVFVVRTSCVENSDACVAGTQFSEVHFNCRAYPDTAHISFINANPPHGPHPISGPMCEGYGPHCGMLIPDPHDESTDGSNKWRQELRLHGNYTDAQLLAMMGECRHARDIRFKGINDKQTYADYWHPQDHKTVEELEQVFLH
eukprot:GILJ01002112.1.p1 GENE.GILJ01002112.1~~GILJ01002112.1.p1  ORF type:complete len:383 (+),score=37.55 GILJ01002112.1:44-1192(+)